VFAKRVLSMDPILAAQAGLVQRDVCRAPAVRLDLFLSRLLASNL
jgi:hypothetical protein